MKIENALRELNLNDKEIRVYLASLRLGQSSANTISKEANLNRVSTYDLLKNLLEKGFVSYVIKSGVKYFEAVDPSKFLADIKEKEAKLKAVMPELVSLRSSLLEKPGIEVYEGVKGLKSIFNDILKEEKDNWWISDVKMIEALQFYFKHFINQKRKLSLFSKVITTDCKKMRDYSKKVPKKYLKMKFIDKEIGITKIIYGNKVAFLTFKEENSIGLLIKNKDIANMEKNMFELLWKNS